MSLYTYKAIFVISKYIYVWFTYIFFCTYLPIVMIGLIGLILNRKLLLLYIYLSVFCKTIYFSDFSMCITIIIVCIIISPLISYIYTIIYCIGYWTTSINMIIIMRNLWMRNQNMCTVHHTYMYIEHYVFIKCLFV